MSVTGRLLRALADYDNSESLGSKLRARRIAPLLEMIETAAGRHGFVNIIDIGGVKNYWDIIPGDCLDRNKVSITIVNLPGENPPGDRGRFRFITADACDLAGFADDSFHIAHSNSVIEHVGGRERVDAFARELSRVAPMRFVQTPNYWFPVEPHCLVPFFHWLPRRLRLWLVRRFQLGYWERAKSADEAERIVESACLLSKKTFQALFHDSRIVTERFLGLPKSFIAVKS